MQLSSPHRRLYGLGVCCADYATRRFSCSEGNRPNPNFAERLYGKESTTRRF